MVEHLFLNKPFIGSHRFYVRRFRCGGGMKGPSFGRNQLCTKCVWRCWTCMLNFIRNSCVCVCVLFLINTIFVQLPSGHPIVVPSPVPSLRRLFALRCANAQRSDRDSCASLRMPNIVCPHNKSHTVDNANWNEMSPAMFERTQRNTKKRHPASGI